MKEHYQQLAVAHERMVREAEEAATAASGTGFLGRYFKRRERVQSRIWKSIVVDISITPPSFKPVSLPLSRSPLSKTPKHVFF